jgi:hypothetical protein
MTLHRNLLLAALLASAASHLAATTLIPMYLDDLTAASQTVVYGKVIGARTEWDAGHNWIYTVYTIQSSEYLKGSLGPSFELRLPGGERDGLEMLVEGVPVFQTGQEAVLFVWTAPDGRHQVTGFEQGAIHVAQAGGGAKLAARTVALGTASPEPTAFSLTPTTRFSSRALPDLFREIRASVVRTRPRTAGE